MRTRPGCQDLPAEIQEFASRRPPGRRLGIGLRNTAHLYVGQSWHAFVRTHTGGVDALVAAARKAGLRDERVLEAIAAVPRGDFVPTAYVGQAEFDAPIPIPHGQVTTQPSLVARIVEALALCGDECVLEIGTGYGWQTALLAELAQEVFSVERFADIAEAATTNLTKHTNVQVIVGDGSAGLPEHAPFDAILVAAAYPSVPAPLAEQLAEGGRLVQPLGPGGAEDVVLFEKRDGDLRRIRSITGARFVRLHGAHGFP